MVFVFVLAFNGFSQLKVNSSGRIGIGGLDPDGTYKFSLYSAIFKTGGGYPDLILGPNPSGTQTRAYTLVLQKMVLLDGTRGSSPMFMPSTFTKMDLLLHPTND